VPKANWYWTMAVSPANANVLLLGTSSGIYRSQDGGKSWKASGLATVNVTSVVADGSTLLAGGVIPNNPDASPVSGTKTDFAPSPGKGTLAESSDGGLTWNTVKPKGLPATGIQALAVDPANAKLVYAVLTNGAIYRSSDAAGSFTLLSTKIGGTPWALVVSANESLAAGNMSSGNYLSSNASSWRKTVFTDPDGSHMVMEYATEPGDPTHILMTSYGVLGSSNAGSSWQVALKSKVMFGPIAFATPSVVYAVGFDQSLWRSTNDGRSWTEVA
jgi:photosystem II stability/assembly factor-like uncharacterized protein